MLQGKHSYTPLPLRQLSTRHSPALLLVATCFPLFSTVSLLAHPGSGRTPDALGAPTKRRRVNRYTVTPSILQATLRHTLAEPTVAKTPSPSATTESRNFYLRPFDPASHSIHFACAIEDPPHTRLAGACSPSEIFCSWTFRPCGGIFPITYHPAPITCLTSAGRAGGR